jgi:hypothetical protein
MLVAIECRQLPKANATILINHGMFHPALLDGEAYILVHVRIIDLKPLLLSSCRRQKLFAVPSYAAGGGVLLSWPLNFPQ